MTHPSFIRMTLLGLLCLLAFSETITRSLAQTGRPDHYPFDGSQLEVRSLQAKAELNAVKGHESKHSEGAAEGKQASSGKTIVSPEFNTNTQSHSHNEADDAAEDIFNDHISRSFMELNNFVLPQSTIITSTASSDPIQKTESQKEQSESEESPIPNLSDLRKISIDELPSTFP